MFWVVDNGSSHSGQPSIDRMRQAWPLAALVHLPVHVGLASQLEIFIPVVQRNVVKRQHLDVVAAWLSAFQDSYNTTAEPCGWRFIRRSVDRLLQRLAAHEAHDPDELATGPTRLRDWRATPKTPIMVGLAPSSRGAPNDLPSTKAPDPLRYAVTCGCIQLSTAT